jgi:hypothetical protein
MTRVLLSTIGSRGDRWWRGTAQASAPTQQHLQQMKADTPRCSSRRLRLRRAIAT